jgi:hypothetical protein
VGSGVGVGDGEGVGVGDGVEVGVGDGEGVGVGDGVGVGVGDGDGVGVGVGDGAWVDVGDGGGVGVGDGGGVGVGDGDAVLLGVGVPVAPSATWTTSSTLFVVASLELKWYPSVCVVSSARERIEPPEAATVELRSTSAQTELAAPGVKVVITAPFAGALP